MRNLKAALMSTALSKVGALLVKGPLGALKEKISPDTYGGTPLLGVKGAVIVGHGSSNETAVKNGIAVAAATVRAHVPEVIAERVAAAPASASAAVGAEEKGEAAALMPDEPHRRTADQARARPEDCGPHLREHPVPALGHHPSFRHRGSGREVLLRAPGVPRRLHLGALVANAAFHQFPELDEGGLTRIKVALVSGASLSEVAEKLGFADVIVFGSSETGTGRRGLHSALENVYEAVVAALFLDGGIDAAWAFVDRTLMPKMSLDLAREPENPKSALQEKLQEGGITPTYRLVETQGPPHDRTFVAQVYAGDKGLAQGVGRTKKEAESQAAKSTLARLSEFFGIGMTEEQAAEKAAEKAARAEEKAATKAARVAEREAAAAAKAAARAERAAAKKKQD